MQKYNYADTFECKNTKLAALRPSAVGIFILYPPGAAQSGNLSDIRTDRPFGNMDDEGAFDYSLSNTLSAGKTEQLFKKISITSMIDLIGADAFDRLINQLDHSCIDPETRSIDIYSGRLENWYEIKFKPIVSCCGRLPEKLLIWFTKVTAQREAELRQRDLLHYTDSLISDIKTLARKKSTYDHLAAYILNNYEGVLITRNDPDGKAV
jgi:hypothetical protein